MIDGIDMKVMSLGGNCADIKFLGDFRVRGPVDNWYALHGFSDVLHLFSDFRSDLINGYKKAEKRKPSWMGDSTLEYFYNSYSCRHLDMNDPVVVKKVIDRLDNLLKFSDEVKTNPHCYFSYVLNANDMYKHDNKIEMKNETIESIKIFGKMFPLNKLVIVGTKAIKYPNRKCFCGYVDNPPNFINYCFIRDILFGGNEETKKRNFECFKKYVMDLVEKNK